MAASNFGNSRVKTKGVMNVGPDFQVSCWVQPSDNWDNEKNQPKPITTDQYNKIGEIMDMINSNGFSLSIVIRERNEGQARSWLEKMKFKLFANNDLEPAPKIETTNTEVKTSGFPNLQK
tara:strand:+ start:194 stop:553 length:360 start_codon:yes stop_codon:yes gene_type:complete